MKLVSFGQQHALQVLVLSPLLQPLLLQEADQLVSLLHHLHDLHQHPLLLAKVRRRLHGIWKVERGITVRRSEAGL